jgi:glutamine amidotransferase
MICIIDYGLGNLGSVSNMIAHIGGSFKVLTNPEELKDAKKILLPGVGAFDHGMNNLIQRKWVKELSKKVMDEKVPILGICLGMQLMCKTSEEGNLPGLGWINAEVLKFNYDKIIPCKVPHMGWNSISVKKKNPLIKDIDLEQRFYFVHSYYVSCNEKQDIIAIANHGHDFVAAFSHDNIYGAQFHPEKSHSFGMSFLKSFIEV